MKGYAMYCRIALLVVTSFFTANANAEDSFRFGLMPTLSNYSIRDPDGPTQNKSSLSALSVVAILDMSRDGRVFVHGYRGSFKADASTTNIGQEVVQMGVGASYQTMLRLARDFKPWVGVGMGFTSETYKNRYTLTSGGFNACPTIACYSDRNVDNYTVLLNASDEWRINSDWDMGLHIQYEHPMSTGASAVRFGIFAVY